MHMGCGGTNVGQSLVVPSLPNQKRWRLHYAVINFGRCSSSFYFKSRKAGKKAYQGCNSRLQVVTVASASVVLPRGLRTPFFLTTYLTNKNQPPSSTDHATLNPAEVKCVQAGKGLQRSGKGRRLRCRPQFRPHKFYPGKAHRSNRSLKKKHHDIALRNISLWLVA